MGLWWSRWRQSTASSQVSTLGGGNSSLEGVFGVAVVDHVALAFGGQRYKY